MPNPIEDDPKLAQAVGVLAGRFGLVEVMIEIIFVALSGCDHRRATILFSFFKSVPTQCEVIKLLAKSQSAIDEPLTERISDALKTFTDLAAKRNGVIHFPFGWDNTNPNNPTIYKMRRTRTGPEVWVKDPASHEAVTSIAKDVDALYRRLLVLQDDIIEAQRSSLLETLTQLPPDQTLDTPILNRLLALFQNEEPQPPPRSSQE